jgi:hypothetical protein
MRRIVCLLAFSSLISIFATGQYNNTGLALSVGTGTSRYLGKGEGDNYFTFSNPSIQFELSIIAPGGFEWTIYGFSDNNLYNCVGDNRVKVKIRTPFYTEFIFFQETKKSPLFVFFGYNFATMRFPKMESWDGHHYLSFGGGWDLKLTNGLYMQFKIKPHIIFDNSIGQKFGFNAMVNMHFRLTG